MNKENNCNFLDKLLKALKKVVDFMAARPEKLNLDAAYGLTLGEGTFFSSNQQRRKIQFLSEINCSLFNYPFLIER